MSPNSAQSFLLLFLPGNTSIVSCFLLFWLSFSSIISFCFKVFDLSQWQCWRICHWRQQGAFPASRSRGFLQQPWWALGGKWFRTGQSPHPTESRNPCRSVKYVFLAYLLNSPFLIAGFKVTNGKRKAAANTDQPKQRQERQLNALNSTTSLKAEFDLSSNAMVIQWKTST